MDGTRVVMVPVLVVNNEEEVVVLHEVALNATTRVNPRDEQSGVTYSVRLNVRRVRLNASGNPAWKVRMR